MLLPGIRRVLAMRQWCNCRTFTDAVPYYSPKVRVLPFAISREDAIINMNAYAKLTVVSKDPSTAWQAAFSSNFIQPKYVQAVYLPAWVVDAEVETNAWLDSTQQLATAQLVDSYVPGFAHDFLSRISLNNEDIAASEAVPFCQDITTQCGLQVLCLPFTISPLSLPLKLQSLPKRVSVTDNLRFDPAIKFNFFAAYPILIPLYLAQYEKDGINTTVALEGFSSMGRIYFEFFDDYWPGSRWYSKFANHVHDDYWQMQGAATPFSKVSMPSRKHTSELQKWLDQMISQPGSPEHLVSKTSVDFADRRVREFTEDETNKNRAFLGVSDNMTQMQYMLKNFTDEGQDSAHNRTVAIKIDLSGISKVGGNDFATVIKSEIHELRMKRDEMMPQWWRDISATTVKST